MAAELRERFGAQVDVVEGDRGVFDVVVDGRRIFSKFDCDRFPEDGEVARLISEA